MAELTLQIVNPGSLEWGSAQTVIKRLGIEMQAALSGIINVKVVDEAEITALNTQYADSAYVTDVLSVSYIEGGLEPVEGELGDIAICLPVARQQAQRADTELSTELALLVLHGSLHILGYDHQTNKQRGHMDELQEQIMNQAHLQYRDFAWKE